MKPQYASQSSAIVAAIAMLAVACTADVEETAPTQRLLRMEMTVCLQPEGDMGATRAPGDPGTYEHPGDPGTYEHLGFPAYLYVYAVGFTADPDDPGSVIPVMDGTEEVNRISLSTDPSHWAHYFMSQDPPQTLNDSVYGSVQAVNFKLSNAAITKIRFYVAASPTRLHHDGHELGVKVGDDDQVMKSTNTEDDVLKLRFDVDDDLRPRLQDLYSSPYNYAPGGTYNNQYYYTIFNAQEAEGRITRIIYHVAAKVDINWNVDPARQADYRITHIEARQLKQHDCYLFRQTENIWTEADDAVNYSQVIMHDDVGQQWYGRQYFYTIPYAYGPTFNTHLHIRKNGDDASAVGYNLKLTKSMAPFPIFTPWLRADLRFTGGMDYNATEKEKSMD